MDSQYDTAPAANPGMIPAARTPVQGLESLPGGRGIADAERGRVLVRYARLMRSGRPEVCRPGRRELEGDPRIQAVGSDGKVIYPDRDAAESSARELEHLGSRPQRAYLCRRSKRGHFHLTTDLVVERRRESLGSVIPQQRSAG
ncbi:hypothetical protein EV383_4006 [Pseudonocardia sediminis]|uniref:Uncharacterized protein n=1 Tax=Pseudonocardia sediminis TaxID=1397368 RepID=A0A4Q7V3D3_PSEST|nr:hypothetical protein [Pseudonocardia sediminis]RZT87099.1 hypothetical protein EV383_4006 [Pseudonocardia sediminis]